jgi:hypothetical protein
MCNNTEPLIQQSWFDATYGTELVPVSGRSRANEYLRIYKPFNYDSCYQTSSAGKPRLQHADTCTVSCR